MLAILALLLTPAGGNAQGSDDWYVIRMAGTPVGWMRDSRTMSDSGPIVSTTMRFVLNRLGSQVVMEMREQSLESGRGSLIRSDGTMRLSEQTTEFHAAMIGDSVRVRTRAGGREFERVLEARTRLIGPGAAGRMTAESLRVRGDSISYEIFVSAAGVPAAVTRTLVGIDTVPFRGGGAAVRRIVERSTASPVAVTYWIDGDGTIVRSAYDSPFGRTESELADSATAMLANEGGTLAEEQYSRTLVPTHVRLPQARRMEMLRLALTTRDTSFEWPALDGDGQRVLSRAQGWLVLEVTRRRPPAGTHPFPVAPTAARREYLAPNAYVQSDEPALHALARRVIGRETDAWRASLELERWVADSMHFDLGVVFAPSVEVLEQRRGSRVAYATLLAALTRTVGIPSRVVFGFAYVNGIF
jgi:hypothetical protein